VADQVGPTCRHTDADGLRGSEVRCGLGRAQVNPAQQTSFPFLFFPDSFSPLFLEFTFEFKFVLRFLDDQSVPNSNF
jgi:hypothetical protein